MALEDQPRWQSVPRAFLFWNGVYRKERVERTRANGAASGNRAIEFGCTKQLIERLARRGSGECRYRYANPTASSTFAAPPRQRFLDTSEISSRFSFVPYEEVLCFAVQIEESLQFEALEFCVFQHSHQDGGPGDAASPERSTPSRLVYWEQLTRDELDALARTLREDLAGTGPELLIGRLDHSGIEDFASSHDGYYTFDITLLGRSGTVAQWSSCVLARGGIGASYRLFDANSNLSSHTTASLEDAEATSSRGYWHSVPTGAEAHDELGRLFNFQRDLQRQRLVNDFARVQRLLRNGPALCQRLARLEARLESHPDEGLLGALTHFESLAHFPSARVMPTGTLSDVEFNAIVQLAYAVEDVGARSFHGALTHRVQWHAVISLMTADFAVPIADGFFHSPLELYRAARGGVLSRPDNPSAAGTVDVWRYVFDRFDRFSSRGGATSDFPIQYPSRQDDDAHYAEQCHMLFCSLPSDPRESREVIRRFLYLPANAAPESASIVRERERPCSSPSKLDDKIALYLQCLDPNSAIGAQRMPTTSIHKGWLMADDEIGLLDGQLRALSLAIHSHSKLAAELRRRFIEAVVAAEVTRELFRVPDLVRRRAPALAGRFDASRSVASVENQIEAVAPLARALSLGRLRDETGALRFEHPTWTRGGSENCLVPRGDLPLTVDLVDALTAESRRGLRPDGSPGPLSDAGRD